jgi:hypothetical protein
MFPLGLGPGCPTCVNSGSRHSAGESLFVYDQWNHCPPHSLQIDGVVDRHGLLDFAFALNVSPQFRHLFEVCGDIFAIFI